ncbi:MAG: tyrosine-type recombinase/integrase [Desulfurococcales archaeon]|nr:tyrosine-type recombinase/integrase [Desulfurococcales archaeon]
MGLAGIRIGRPPRGIYRMSVGEAVEIFIEMLAAGGASDSTVKSYRAALNNFASYIGPDTPLEDVAEEDYIGWMSTLRKRSGRGSRGVRQNTLHYYTLFVKRFLEWAGVARDLPVIPRKRHIMPDTLSWSEVERLIQSSRDMVDALAVALMAESGLRAGELLNLRVRDLDPERGEIRVRGKYGKERIVFMGPVSRALVRAYLESMNPSPRERIIPLTYQALYKRLKALARRAGIDPGRVRPHVLRHTFATEAVRRGMSLPVLQKLLGHTDIKVTEVYLHMTMEDARREYESIFSRGAQGARSSI